MSQLDWDSVLVIWIWCAWQTGLLFPTICSAPAIGLYGISYTHVRIPVRSAGWVWSSLTFAWSLTCFGQWPWAAMAFSMIKGKLWMWLSAVPQPLALSLLFCPPPWELHDPAGGCVFTLGSGIGCQVKQSPAEPNWTQPIWTHPAVVTWARNKRSLQQPLRLGGWMLLQEKSWLTQNACTPLILSHKINSEFSNEYQGIYFIHKLKSVWKYMMPSLKLWVTHWSLKKPLEITMEY